MSSDEVQKMVEHLKDLGIKPKVDSKEDFQTWMKSMAESVGQTSSTQVPVYFPSKFQHFPKLSNFCGDEKKTTSYDVWRNEVECIQKEGHSEQTVAQAVRSSLRGFALRIRARLGPEATVKDILAKFDSVYGIVEQGEMLLAKFYSARQTEDEDVVSWSCRLEDLLAKVKDKGYVEDEQMDSMLRSMFWSGLRQNLKDVTGHLFDRITDFDELRVAVRRFEQDRQQRKVESKDVKKAQAKSAVEVSSGSELSEVKATLNQLVTEMKGMKDNQDKFEKEFQDFRKGSRFNNQRGRGRGRGRNFQPPQACSDTQPSEGTFNAVPQSENDTEVFCYRCGQAGHFAIGCRVRLDHMRRSPLNGNRPTQGDGW